MATEISKNPQTPTSEYWGGFFDAALSFYIFEDRRWLKDTPRTSPPNRIYYKPRLEINRLRGEVPKLVQNFFPDFGGRIMLDGKGHSIWLLKNAEDIYAFLDEIEPSLIFNRPLSEKMREFLSFRIARKESGNALRPLDPDEEEEYRKRYSDFQRARSTVFEGIYIPSPARLAGMIDASGSISISRNVDKESLLNEYTLLVRIPYQHSGFFAGMRQKFGGYKEHSESKKSDEEVAFAWVGSYLNARKVLEYVFPHLILRRSQAELGLDFQLALQRFSRRHLQLPIDRMLPYTHKDLVDILYEGFMLNVDLLNEDAKKAKD